MNYVSLDTGPIVEYVDLDGTYHAHAKAIFDSLVAGEILGLITHPVLAETYYVSLRVYEKLGLDEPETKAQKLVEWLYSSPQMQLADQTLELAIAAGKIKKRYSLALTDAYVMASSKLYKGKAVFRTREKEVQKRITELSRNYTLIFLEDYVS